MKEIKLYKDLADRYLKAKIRETDNEDEMMIRRVGYAVERFGNRKLTSFSKKDVTLYKEDMLDRGLANSTVNAGMTRFLGVLRYGMEELEIVPSVPRFKKLPEESEKGRVLSNRDISRLVSELPPLLGELFEFGIITGLRGTNLKMLQWDEVEYNNSGQHFLKIAGKAMKNRKRAVIPLPDAAVAILDRREQKQLNNGEYVDGNKPKYIFTLARTKKPYSPKTRLTNNAWRSAVKRAGIDPCVFHDTRRTFTTRHIEAGTPEHVICKLGAWKTTTMVHRYARLHPTSLAQWANNTDHLNQVKLDSVVQFPSKHSTKQKSGTVLEESDKIASKGKV